VGCTRVRLHDNANTGSRATCPAVHFRDAISIHVSVQEKERVAPTGQRGGETMDHKLFDVAGKKALVTGGAVGIGRACATADVAIIGRTRKTAEKTCSTLQTLGVTAIFCRVRCSGSAVSVRRRPLQLAGQVSLLEFWGRS
jgi:hypothetical protein